ncbi:hypothetical protein D3C80_1016760 [compost metagenome]
MPFTRLVAAQVQPTQGSLLPRLPAFHMHRSTDHICPKRQLRQQPVRRHLAVGIGTGQPAGALFDHLGGPSPACHANVAGVNVQRLHAMTPGHRRATVTAAVQHHQDADLVARLLGLRGRDLDRLEAPAQAARLVVRGDHHGNHGQVSSRSTTLGWHDQYSSRKSASSWRYTGYSGRCLPSIRCTSRPSCGQPAIGCFQ